MHSRFNLASIVPVPWKNGGGLTRELACWPAGSGIQDFEWRVSVAEIRTSGPFSKFAGVDRTIVLLDGAGMHLRSRDRSVDHRLVVSLEPFEFSGDLAMDCELCDGVSHDFNVMTRRNSTLADLEVVRSERVLTPGSSGLLFAVTGHWSAGADSPEEPHEEHRLAPRTGLWWANEAPQWTLAPDRDEKTPALIAVRFAPRIQ